MTTIQEDIEAAFEEFLQKKDEYKEDILHETITEREMVIENMMAAIQAGDNFLVGKIVREALKDYIHDIDTANPKHPIPDYNELEQRWLTS